MRTALLGLALAALGGHGAHAQLAARGAHPAPAQLAAPARAPQALRFDPFVSAPGSARLSARSSNPGETWSPVLRATLLAGPRPLANLGGVVLTLGEEINGYQLLEVREGEAVFRVGDQQLILAVSPEAAP